MSRSGNPLVAVNGLLLTDGKAGLRLDNRYADAVLRAGGIPVAIPPVGGPDDVARLVDRVDAVLLTGGDDFDTARLGLGQVHAGAVVTPPAKQEFDFHLARVALAAEKPVLGICYGMQVLGLVGGSELHQHLPDDRPGGREHRDGVVHAAHLAPDSKLARLYGVERVRVISRHHQALASVAPPWTVTAVDDEGLIEAIERPDHSFAVGVQWHPELEPEGSPHDRLFRGFVGAAGMAAAAREFQRAP